MDNWGVILNQSREVFIYDFDNIIGFNNGISPIPPDTGYPQNFNNGNFFNFGSSVDGLPNEQYRILLKFKYATYTTNCSYASLTNIINYYIQQQYNNLSKRCDIIDGIKTFTYAFNFTLQPWEIGLFAIEKILPSPAGIRYTVTYV